MSGNAREWCNDWFGSYNSGIETDPSGPDTGSARVVRGGGCTFGEQSRCWQDYFTGKRFLPAFILLNKHKGGSAMRIRGLVVFAICGWTMACQAGLVINMESRDLREGKAAQTMKMYISGKMINMDVVTEEHKGTTIFRGDKDLFWTIDHQNKEYTEITRETMEAMGRSMGAALDQMKEQMANMPAEQRAMMEQMMQGQTEMMNQAASKPLTLKKTGKKKKIGGFACTLYECYQGEEKVREMWMTDWKGITGGTEATEAFEAMSRFFKSLVETHKNSPFAQMLDNPYAQANTVNGFPVLVTEIENGVAAYETLFKGIEKMSVKADIFEPPKGYKRNVPQTGKQ
jgi:hypothetical protein